MKTFKKPLCFQHRLIIRLFFHPLFGTAVTVLASSGRQRGTRSQEMNDIKHTSASSQKVLPGWRRLVVTQWLRLLVPFLFPANVELWHPGSPVEYPGNAKLTSVLILNSCQPNLQTQFISSPLSLGDIALRTHSCWPGWVVADVEPSVMIRKEEGIQRNDS